MSRANPRMSLPIIMLAVFLAVGVGWGCGASADDAPEMSPEPVFMPAPPDASTAHEDQEPPWLSQDGTIDEATLHGWLRAGSHRSWASSSDIIQTDEGGSRVFLNASLAADRSESEQPISTGAVGVRELYESDFQTLRAFNVMVKVADDGREEGEDWMWFEIDAQSPTPSFSVSERGASVCVACHGPSPDPLMSPWPLP